MVVETPYSYVDWYYDNDCRLRDNFPEATAFIDRFMSEVKGDVVLNAGCGPQFYDLVPRFGRAPKEYVGVDFGQETIRFLAESQKSRFLGRRAKAEDTGCRFETACHDILTWPGLEADRFDTVIASGFIGTFHDDKLRELLAKLRQTLKPAGRLVKLTWHGPHRTPEQTAKKLEYGYDSLEEHNPESFLKTIEDCGFLTREHKLLECDPETYRWDVIQGCVFEKC